MIDVESAHSPAFFQVDPRPSPPSKKYDSMPLSGFSEKIFSSTVE